ncbi:hypothetical protein PTKIN_Ptkin04bG0174200 [Pterospermum kingtungense]
MSSRREPTPAQRRAKNERDRRRREQHNTEFKRLQRVDEEMKSLRDENRQLREENRRLNDMLSNSNIRHQLREQNLELEETVKLVESRFELDKFPSPNEEVANNEPIITQCSESSQSAMHYAALVDNFCKELDAKAKSSVDLSVVYEMSQVVPWFADKFPSLNEEIAHNAPLTQGAIRLGDEIVEDFIKKIDAKEKSNVDFSDFDGLKEEMETSGINSLPPSVAPFDTKIKEIYGKIDADSKQSSCTAMATRILFCAAIKEMSNLQLEQIDKRRILLWRDAINSALNINFRVEFAIEHLKKIARAYYGLNARIEQASDPELLSIMEKISELVIEQRALEAKHAQKVEARNFEMSRQCVHDAEYFAGKRLSTGLLH